MKVLVLCYEYPPIGGGGGRVAAQVAEQLGQRGHSIRVIAGGIRKLPDNKIVDAIQLKRIYSPRRSADRCSVFEMAAFLIWAFPEALKTVLQWKPDVIHAHFAVPTGALAYALHLFTKTPYIITAHLGDVPGGVPQQTDSLFRLLKPLTTPIWRNATHITAVSSFVAQLAHDAYQITPTIIWNGISLPQQHYRDFTQPWQFLWVGRFSLQKDPILAIEAFARFNKSDAKLIMIGDGPLRPEIEEAIHSNRLTSRVTLTGWLSADQVSDLMWKSHALLMTSTHEGLPMVAVEAIARGLPIISTDIPGIRDVVAHEKNGFLTKPTPSAIADALAKTTESSDQLTRFSTAALQKATQFDIKSIIDAYEVCLRAS